MMTLNETVAAPITQKVAAATSAGGLGLAAYFGITSQELGMFIGLFIAFGGGATAALINYHFRKKHFEVFREYVMNGKDRRKTERREDPPEDICNRCPLVKHRTDCDA